MSLELIGTLVIIAFICVGIGYVVVRVIVNSNAMELESEVVQLISESRRRLNGSNRFVLNEEVLKELYPEYSSAAIREVWRRLVEFKRVTQDPMDNEWCVR